MSKTVEELPVDKIFMQFDSNREALIKLLDGDIKEMDTELWKIFSKDNFCLYRLGTNPRKTSGFVRVVRRFPTLLN